MPGPTTITPSNGTWVKAGKWRPGGLAGTPIYPANGTWVVVGQCPANPWGYNLSFGQRSGL